MNIDKTILSNYIQDPDNVENCLALAEAYMDLNQPSAAFTYYMKCAERCPEQSYEMRYHCLNMISFIYETLGERWLGSMQYARLAKTIQPDRPEAYYQFCKQQASQLIAKGQYEQWDWVQVYENAKIGCLFAKVNPRPVCRYYDGLEHLAIYYCIAMLRMNLHDELKDFLKEFEFTDLRHPVIFNTLLYIYEELKITNPYINYCNLQIADEYKSLLDQVSIQHNYSKNLQDIFAILMAFDSTSYLEIGMPDINRSNTRLLSELGWSGWSLSNDLNQCNEFNLKRQVGRCLTSDLVSFDYESLVNSYKSGDKAKIGYLSISSFDYEVNNKVVTKFPWNKFEIDIVTITHGPNKDNFETVDRIMQLNDFVPVVTNIHNGYGEVVDSWYISKRNLDNNKLVNMLYNKLKHRDIHFGSIFS